MVDGYRRGFIKEVVSVVLVLLSVVVVWLINPYVNTFIRENTSVYEKIQDVSGAFVESLTDGKTVVDGEQQNELISGMNLPGLLQNGIADNNTAAVYQSLAVNTFGEYVSHYLANIAASVLIHVFAYALDLLARLPVLCGINKMAGALVGGGKCIIFIWVAMLVVTILCNTKIGQEGLRLIRGDTVLNFLYDKNIFIRIFAGINRILQT